MKQFLRNIILFTAITLVGYSLLIFLAGFLPVPLGLKPNLKYFVGSNGHLFSRIQDLKHRDEGADLLVVGSSHVYRGFDPRNFPGVSMFNLGSSSQTPIQSRVLLERYVDRLNPKTVVIDIYPSTFFSDGVESSIDLIANDINDCKSLRMAWDVNDITTYNTLIYGFCADFLHLNDDYVEPTQRGKDTYIPGGYVERVMEYNPTRNYSKTEWKFMDVQLESFHRCLDWLKQRNIKVILVFVPIAPKLYHSATNNAYVDSLFNSYQLDYYNFNELIHLDDSLDFYDPHHLNQRGTNAFNKAFREIVKL